MLPECQEVGDEVLFPFFIQYLHSVPKEWFNHQAAIHPVIEMVEKHS